MPGNVAPSVISDNRWGATELTLTVLDDLAAKHIEHPLVHFIGGVASDNSTAMRISGFRQAMVSRGQAVNDEQIDASGYAPELAEASIRSLYQRLGKLPDGLIVNSTIAFEGIVRFFRTLPREMLHSIVVGCYDWDPFAALVEFPLTMVRQDVDAMVAKAFEMLDGEKMVAGKIELIRPKLVRSVGAGHSG
ncbi:substrate-binding domain-containing protein [Devosia sp. 2618]|uniref:substrate-binding domain-containing protein n=1 Tax=Devosia sp. 2618 TaxID=3156454 RepID=UPI0033955198